MCRCSSLGSIVYYFYQCNGKIMTILNGTKQKFSRYCQVKNSTWKVTIVLIHYKNVFNINLNFILVSSSLRWQGYTLLRHTGSWFIRIIKIYVTKFWEIMLKLYHRAKILEIMICLLVLAFLYSLNPQTNSDVHTYTVHASV